MKICQKLKQIQSDVSGLKSDIESLKDDVQNLKEGQSRIEKKLDGVHEQTGDLIEFRTETKESIAALRKDINMVINVTKSNCYDITYLKSAK